MRMLVLVVAGAMAGGAAPQESAAQTRDRDNIEQRIREQRRQELAGQQRRQSLERQNAALRRVREQTYNRGPRRDDDRSIADILLDRRDRERRDRDRDRRDRDDDWRRRDDRRAGDQRAAGPAFCRSGEGHPVFGRQWCRDKGWALGSDRAGRFERRRDDVLRRAPLPSRERDRRLDAAGRARGAVR